MNKYRKFAIGFIAFELLIVVVMNLYIGRKINHDTAYYYRVDISRIEDALKEGKNIDEIDLQSYQYVVSVHPYETNEENKYRNQYVVKEINGQLLCFEYINQDNSKEVFLFNIFAALLIGVNVILMVYLDRKMISPFNRINHLTAELAKGNLSVPIAQEKSKYFGRFLWGMDMLRETLEGDKRREMELLKEKKTLVLSLSHDIKTPLSAIDLYTKALRTNLYESEEERASAYEGIEKNIEEIKKYVKEIAEASREDFLVLDVNNSDIYIGEILNSLREYYEEKMKRLHIEFTMASAENCLVHGDYDRVIEVLQNIIENAIKYGDGKWVNISIDEEEDCKLICVTNSGCTLTPDELPNIFDSFYRGRNSDRQEGSGLGLYICKQLMRRMDGDVFAKIKDETFSATVVIRKC